MLRNYTNVSPQVNLTQAVTAAATTLPVGSTTGYPDVPFTLTIDRLTANEEVCLCTDKTATTFVVERGWDGTTARIHDVGIPVEHTVTAEDFRQANTHVEDTGMHVSVPLGGVVIWPGSPDTIPDGWALCDGTQGTPDFRGLFPVGASRTGGYASGDTGGANEVTLSTAQIPAHGHAASTGSAGGHAHVAGSTNTQHVHSTSNAGSHSHGGSANSGGFHRHTFKAAGLSAPSEGGPDQPHHHVRPSEFGVSTQGDIDSISLRPTPVSEVMQEFPSGIHQGGSHGHTLSLNSAGTHNHGNTGNMSANSSHIHTVSSEPNHSHTVTVSNAGGGGAHENRPPYLAVCFIQRKV